MPQKRNIYLVMKSLAEAGTILDAAFPLAGELKPQTAAVTEAVGRVLAEPVFARFSAPNFHAAAMDGIAVKAENTFGAHESRPLTLKTGEDAVYVNTGHPMPPGMDAVIMIEHVQQAAPDQLVIEAPAFPWQNVRRLGEDIVATELLFPRRHLITPYCIGALISAGITEVKVLEKPRVRIMPTGSEIVDWQARGMPADLAPGQVPDSNSHVLGQLVAALGGVCERGSVIRDDPAGIRQAVCEALDQGCHLVLIVGGSSAGSEDFARTVIAELGEVLIHGVTIMPGKPVIAGKVAGRPVFGIPGYPVSAIVAFEQLVQPLICRLLGRPAPERESVAVTPTRKIPSKLGMEEFLRVKLGKVGDRIMATALPRGAGSITTLTDAHGIIRIPNSSEGIGEGEVVRAELLQPRSVIENTIVVVGSHDNTLDVLADEIRAAGRGHVTLSSIHVGSMGGLAAIRKGGCHAAGTHLLDTKDGTYNVSYIERYVPDLPVRLVNLVMREQGLMVPRGNPKNIKGIEDLARGDVRFINRQSGSGTRILLDFSLQHLGLDPERLNGYTQEEFTHMAVAVAVLGKAADVGLGILAAARALGLDFIPVVTEQYDLLILECEFGTPKIQILMETINSKAFKDRVRALGGYGTEKTGQIVWRHETRSSSEAI